MLYLPRPASQNPPNSLRNPFDKYLLSRIKWNYQDSTYMILQLGWTNSQDPNRHFQTAARCWEVGKMTFFDVARGSRANMKKEISGHHCS